MDETMPEDRGSNGRFLRGNKAAKGNPNARRIAQYRKRFQECVTEEDFRAVVNALIQSAIDGDVAAMKIFFEYTMGKPKQEVDVEESPAQSKSVSQETLEYYSRLMQTINQGQTGEPTEN